MSTALYPSRGASLNLFAQNKIIALLIILITFAFSLSFRERELGETSLDLQNGIKFLLWCIVLGLSLFNVQKLTPLIASPSGFALTLLSILALASASWSEKPLYSIACAIGFTGYNTLASMSLYEMSDDELYKIIRTSLFAFVSMSFLAALLFPDSAWQPPSIEETTERLQGLAVNPNNFGRIAALLFLLSLGAWMKDHNKRSLIMVLSIGAGFAGVILSGSRTALAASLLAAAFIYLSPHRLFRLCLFGLCILLTMFLFLMSYGVSLTLFFKILSRTGLESEIFTFTGRTDLWSAALDMIREKPLFGWGFNSTEEHFSLLFNQDFYGTPVNPHQMILHLTLGTGIVGASLALIIFTRRLKMMMSRPNTLNDLMSLFILIYGFTEVDLFATPLFTSLIFFRIVLQDGQFGRLRYDE